MIVLTTPGYGEITDLLIAYGLCEGISRAYPEKLKNSFFISTGFTNQIHLDTDDSKWLDKLTYGLIEAGKEMIDLWRGCERQGFWVSFGSPMTRLKPGKPGSKQPGYSVIPRQLINSLREHSSIHHGLSSFSSQHQCFSKTTGKKIKKRGEKEEITAYLPITPHLGDKRPFLYQTKASANLSICSICNLLSWIGFHYFVGFYAHQGKKDFSSTYFLCSPGVRVPLLDFLILRDLGTRMIPQDKVFRSQELHLPATALYHFSRGETVFPLMLRFPWRLIVYKISKTGQSPAIRSFSSYHLNPLLEFVAHIKSKTKYWWKFVDACARSQNPDPQTFLNLLAEGLLFRQVGSIYKALRLARSIFDRSEKEDEQNLYIPHQQELMEQSVRAAFQVLI